MGALRRAPPLSVGSTTAPGVADLIGASPEIEVRPSLRRAQLRFFGASAGARTDRLGFAPAPITDDAAAAALRNPCRAQHSELFTAARGRAGWRSTPKVFPMRKARRSAAAPELAADGTAGRSGGGPVAWREQSGLLSLGHGSERQRYRELSAWRRAPASRPSLWLRSDLWRVALWRLGSLRTAPRSDRWASSRRRSTCST
jgi:hypothetical protein